jgi:hypothetical protein
MYTDCDVWKIRKQFTFIRIFLLSSTLNVPGPGGRGSLVGPFPGKWPKRSIPSSDQNKRLYPEPG